MNDEQQNQCVGLLLAIAMEGSGKLSVESIQAKVKAFLAKLPAEVVAKAAGTPMGF